MNTLTDWFHILAIMNSAAIILQVQIPLQRAVFISFGHIPSSKIAGSQYSSISSLLGKTSYCFPYSCTNLHSHQQCRRVLFSLYFHKRLLFFLFLIVAWICTFLSFAKFVVFSHYFLKSLFIPALFFLPFWSFNDTNVR
jgi:hypothetical protein